MSEIYFNLAHRIAAHLEAADDAADALIYADASEVEGLRECIARNRAMAARIEMALDARGQGC